MFITGKTGQQPSQLGRSFKDELLEEETKIRPLVYPKHTKINVDQIALKNLIGITKSTGDNGKISIFNTNPTHLNCNTLCSNLKDPFPHL